MEIKIDDFPKKKNICYNFGGDNISPQISWNMIENTKSYALVLEDPDAVVGTFVHWYIPYISNKINLINPLSFLDYKYNNNININLNNVSILFGINTLNKIGYTGPCPPKGTGEHRYIFNLYALDGILKIDKDNIHIKDSKNFEELLKKNSINYISKDTKQFNYKFYD
jgi:Raf kinase inhibitor-like YbhB/YbcL family protein